MLIDNHNGGYMFIRGIGPFSAGIRTKSDFAIVHASFKPFAPLNRGYDLIERHLQDAGRPMAALCGIQLRIPQPLSREGFEQFNQPYINKLREWGLELNSANPVTRTNVALKINPVSEPSIASFFYTIPSLNDRPSWVISGVPEMVSRDGAIKIAAAGDTSPDGMRQKMQCVLDVIERHLTELQLGWAQATTINLYTIHDLHPLLTSMILPRIGAAQSGITLHHARPPVIGLELEIDAWSVSREEILTS